MCGLNSWPRDQESYADYQFYQLSQPGTPDFCQFIICLDRFLQVQPTLDSFGLMDLDVHFSPQIWKVFSRYCFKNIFCSFSSLSGIMQALFLSIVSHNSYRLSSLLFYLFFLFVLLTGKFPIISSRSLILFSVWSVYFWDYWILQLLYFSTIGFLSWFGLFFCFFLTVISMSIFLFYSYIIFLILFSCLCSYSSLNFLKRIILNFLLAVYRSLFFFSVTYWSFISFI